MKTVKLNNSNVYSGVKFLNLVKKGRKIKIRIFIKEQKKENKQERIWLEKLVQKPIA